MVNKNKVNSGYGDKKKTLPTFSASQRPTRVDYFTFSTMKDLNFL